MRIPLKLLGQSGCKLEIEDITMYVDPYLSNSVEELDDADLKRLKPIEIKPENVTDADWVLITHEHIDHCDPHSIPKIAKSSPKAIFVGPASVIKILREWGIKENRLHQITNSWTDISKKVSIKATPAAHPEIDFCEDGTWRYVGYLIKIFDECIYIAGDTLLCDEIVDYLSKENIHTAFLPVNEINYFRNQKGIIGNMSVREAFGLASELGIKQVVAVHWDMFDINYVFPEEIRTIHKKMECKFNLLLQADSISLGKPKISIILRTLNEERYLAELLKGIYSQKIDSEFEIILIDSGSTDSTLEIAEKYGCYIIHISREEFSFGRSLNKGCEAAAGDVLVITSGHCVPFDEYWLQNLCQPIIDGLAYYTYGRQIGGEATKFSENQVFLKYFPNESMIPQEGFYCNNANSAILKSSWEKFKFDECLTGLEDTALAKQLVNDGGKIGYVSNACVYHHHDESWQQIQRRFEREALALQQIMPQIHISKMDTFRYIMKSIWLDLKKAKHEGVMLKNVKDIALYRYHQYVGGYLGNHEHKKLSHKDKEKYYYPE